jgi:TonB family protein
MGQDKKQPKAEGEKRPAAGGFRLAGFPSEFERNIWEDLDKRFFLIVIISWATVFTLVTILGNTEFDDAAAAAAARKSYLEKFYQAEIVEPFEAIEEEDTGLEMGGESEEQPESDARAERDQGRQGEARGPSAKEVAEARRAAAAQRSAARRQMEQQVAGTGVLGVLSAGGGGGSGDAVADVLGSAGGGTGDLNEILSGVGGLATASSAGQKSRLGSRGGGGRVTGSADVNELLSGVGSAGSANIGRKGSIGMALESARVSGKGSKSANRSGDELSRVINSHNDAVEYCYKREAKLNPNLKGDILVEFVVSFNGRVTNVRITSSSLRNKKVESCISGRIRGWRFKPIDKKEGDVTVRQKYIFG